MLVMSSTPIAVGVVNQGYHSDDVTIDMETANQETTDEVWKDVTCSFSISKQITDIENCSNLLSLEVNIHNLLKEGFQKKDIPKKYIEEILNMKWDTNDI